MHLAPQSASIFRCCGPVQQWIDQALFQRVVSSEQREVRGPFEPGIPVIPSNVLLDAVQHEPQMAMLPAKKIRQLLVGGSRRGAQQGKEQLFFPIHVALQSLPECPEGTPRAPPAGRMAALKLKK